MRGRVVAVIVALIAALLVPAVAPVPAATQESGGEEVAVDSPAHRAALADLDTVQGRIADQRAALVDVDQHLAERRLAADHLRDAIPVMRSRRASARSRLEAGHDELRRIAALRFVMVGSGRTTENLFSTDETLSVLRRQLLLELADVSRRTDLERDQGTLADAGFQVGVAEQGLADLERRIAELDTERAQLEREIDAAAGELPGLIDAVDRTRREALEAMTVPTTVTTTITVPDPPPTTDPPATDPPATDPPATDPPATDPPATDPPATDPPTTVSQPSVGGRHVDMVGDSLTASARDELSAALGRFGTVRIDALEGRALIGGQAALDAIGAGDPDIVVIALGTNDTVPGPDYGALVRRSLDVVDEAACVVWVDVQEVVPGLAEVNRTIHAASVDAVASWSAVAGPPHLHISDGYHLSDVGQETFAALVADTVGWACDGG